MENKSEKIERKAREWMEEQQTNRRPGSLNNSPAKNVYIPKGVSLSPVVKMVSPNDLHFNPLNDFERLPEKEYEELKSDISRNGILDTLTVKKDHVIVTGENRLRIALELLSEGNDKVKFIPVRFYMTPLTKEEEYDILEGDNLYRRHLTAEQRKERIKSRIKRKYKDELLQDNRGGDRKSEKSDSIPEEMDLRISQKFTSFDEEISEKIEITKQQKEISKIQGESLIGEEAKSNYEGRSLISEKKELAKVISENEKIPLGTARNYLTEIKKELKPKVEPKKEPSVLTDEEKALLESLAIEINAIDEQIQGLKVEVKRLEDLKKRKVKELKTIGQGKLFGV